MWVGVLIGVVAGLVAIAVPLALILGVPLADAMRVGAGVSGALILAAATLFILPAALIGMVLFLVFEFLRDLGGVGSAAAGGAIGGDLPDVQDLLGSTATDGPALGVVALVIAIVVAFVVVRALVKRPGRSTVDGDIVELREGEGPIGIRLHRPRRPIPRRHPRPAERERGLRGEPRDPCGGPDRCAVRPKRPPSTRTGSTPIRSGRRWGAWPPTTHSSNSATGRCRRPSTVERSSAGGACVRSTVSRGTGPIGQGGPTDRPSPSAFRRADYICSMTSVPFLSLRLRMASYASRERWICRRLTSGMISTRTTTTAPVHSAKPNV